MYRNNLLPLNVSRGRNPFFDTCYTIQYGRYRRTCMHVYRKYICGTERYVQSVRRKRIVRKQRNGAVCRLSGVPVLDGKLMMDAVI